MVIDLIRGRKVEAAMDILRFSGRRAAGPISKVLRSAVANAEQQSTAVDVDDLFVKEAYVDLGPTKWRFRMRPVPMGRAFRERRRQSHITIRVSDGKA